MLDLITGFLVLSLLEILLGIDNLVILGLLVIKLPSQALQKKAQFIGLSIALIMRITLLFSITWIMKLNTPLFSIFHHDFTIKSIILLAGGLFLIYTGIKEIYIFIFNKNSKESSISKSKSSSLLIVIIQLALMDLLFALDSIITAIAISNNIWIMIAANIFSICLMLLIVNWMTQFLQKNPEFKLLGLCFVFVVGVMLILDSIGFENTKGYLYSIIFFSLTVQILNTIYKKNN